MIINVPAELLVLIGLAIPVAIYLMRRRDSQASTLTESKVLTAKSVRNIEELWDKRDDQREDIADVRERLARIEGAHEAEQRMKTRQ